MGVCQGETNLFFVRIKKASESQYCGGSLNLKGMKETKTESLTKSYRIEVRAKGICALLCERKEAWE